jgi:hypothetical protein
VIRQKEECGGCRRGGGQQARPVQSGLAEAAGEGAHAFEITTGRAVAVA